MNNSTFPETDSNFKKVIRYLRISVLVNFIITIPLSILAIFAIGEKTIFILTIIFVGLLCLQFLVLVTFDFIRMYKGRKTRESE